MVAKGIWAAAHAVATPAILIAAAVALAAYPTAVELLETAAARGAVGRNETSTGGAGIVVVDALGVVKMRAVARLLSTCTVDGGVGAEAVVYHHVDVAGAGWHVVVMEIEVSTHLVCGLLVFHVW